jgi:hypothetical protein
MDEITFGYNLPHNEIDFRLWVNNCYRSQDNIKIIFEGNLDLREHPNVILPNNLTVNGFLDVSYLGISKLPKNLTVNGGLYTKNNKLTSLPSDLFVMYCAYLDCNIITNEIKSDIGGLIIMDEKQEQTYLRWVKINNIVNIISNAKKTK